MQIFDENKVRDKEKLRNIMKMKGIRKDFFFNCKEFKRDWT